MNLRILIFLAIGLISAFFLVYAGWFLIPDGFSFGPFDHRAIQHLVGFLGLAIILQGIVSSCYSKESYVLHATLLGGAVVMSWLAWFYPTVVVLSGEVRALASVIRNPGTIWFLCALVMARVFRTDKRWLVAIGGLALCIFVSFYWELYRQPMVAVYDGPPRNEIQTPQVIADFVAITLAFVTLWGITLNRTCAKKAAQAG